MYRDFYAKRYHLPLVIGFALVLTVAAYVPLFLLIDFCRIYVAMVKGEFYTPFVNPPSLLDRAFSSLYVFRPALWTAVAFILLEAGATYAVSRLIRSKGRFAGIRRVSISAAIALLVSCLLQFVMWRVVRGSLSH